VTAICGKLPRCPQDCDIANVYDTITSSTQKITLEVWDHGDEDGDRIDIILNGTTVRSNMELTSARQYVEIILSQGNNTVDIKALNQGTAGDNTAAFTVTDEDSNELLNEYWYMFTGEINRLLVIYQP